MFALGQAIEDGRRARELLIIISTMFSNYSVPLELEGAELPLCKVAV